MHQLFCKSLFFPTSQIFYFIKRNFVALAINMACFVYFFRLLMLVLVLVFMLVLQIFLSPFDVVKCSNNFGIWWIFLSSASISKVRFVYFGDFSPFHVWHQASAAINKVQLGAPNFPILQLNAAPKFANLAKRCANQINLADTN